MGKSSRRKQLEKTIGSVHSGKMPFIEKTDWANYVILEIRGDTIVARNKITGKIHLIWPVAPWEIDNLNLS